MSPCSLKNSKSFFACKNVCLSFFSIQKTRSWDVHDLKLLGDVCCGSKFGLATLLVSDHFCTIEGSWEFEERCAAVLFQTTLVMAVCAPDCKKDLDMYEAFVSSVTEVLEEGRRGGARELCIAGDLNVDFE